MQEQSRKDLTQICLDIINDTQGLHLSDQLVATRTLYERLIIQNYLAQNSQPTEPIVAPMETVTEEPAVEEKKTEVIAQEPQEAAPEQEGTPAIPISKQTESITFVKMETSEEVTQTTDGDETTISETKVEIGNVQKETSINERYRTGTIKLGLNDRIAFQNHLFEGSQQDLNRVLSQINTFQNYKEAEEFIHTMVKGDYDWTEHEETEARFMEVVRGKFGE